jgi:rod shape-determining protein MreD
VNDPIRSLEGLLRRLVPFLTALFAIALDLMPLPNSAPQTLAPSLTVCVFAYWALARPDLMTPLATFTIGLVLDAAGGLPLGLSALAFLIARSALLTGQPYLLAQPYPVLWACFMLVALSIELLRWMVASLYWDTLLAIEPILLQSFLTVAFYPVVSALLSRLQRQLVQPAHATRS